MARMKDLAVALEELHATIEQGNFGIAADVWLEILSDFDLDTAALNSYYADWKSDRELAN